MGYRILFVANHSAGGNDDEGAITHALTQLGHEVLCLPESRAQSAPAIDADLCLFVKWSDRETISRLSCPAVFWWFDLVAWHHDITLRSRSRARVEWMRSTLPLVALGFLSDGDYALRQPGKLHWLPQGADERVAGRGVPRPGGPEILFTGISRAGGRERQSFVDDLRTRYGRRFEHVERGVYRESLRDLIASAKVVVAPDSPATDRYWSNRVWNALGFGAFLLHPRCERLTECYQDGREIVLYGSREELFRLIDFYLDRPDERAAISEAGLQRTLDEHTYRHRARRLIEVCLERGVLR